MDKNRIELGQVVKDTITNFKGTATSRVMNITGPDRIQVEGFALGGKAPESAWFDEERLEISE